MMSNYSLGSGGESSSRFGVATAADSGLWAENGTASRIFGM